MREDPPTIQAECIWSHRAKPFASPIGRQQRAVQAFNTRDRSHNVITTLRHSIATRNDSLARAFPSCRNDEKLPIIAVM